MTVPARIVPEVEEFVVEAKIRRQWTLRQGPHVMVTGESDGGEMLTITMPGLPADLRLSKQQADALVKLIGMWERTL